MADDKVNPEGAADTPTQTPAPERAEAAAPQQSTERVQERFQDRPRERPQERPQERSADRPDRPYRRESRGGGPGGGRPRGPRRGGRGRRRVCRFCADKTVVLDYKWVETLQDFVTERGKVVPSRTTGTCAKHQRSLAQAIKRARNAALLSYTSG